jgi:hypothetical protein
MQIWLTAPNFSQTALNSSPCISKGKFKIYRFRAPTAEFEEVWLTFIGAPKLSITGDWYWCCKICSFDLLKDWDWDGESWGWMTPKDLGLNSSAAGLKGTIDPPIRILFWLLIGWLYGGSAWENECGEFEGVKAGEVNAVGKISTEGPGVRVCWTLL